MIPRGPFQARTFCDSVKGEEEPSEPHGGDGQPQDAGLSKETPFPVGAHAPSCPEAPTVWQ